MSKIISEIRNQSLYRSLTALTLVGILAGAASFAHAHSKTGTKVQARAQSDAFVVHEWGTFTAVQGSDGLVQEGLHHEEESLPDFVHGRDPLTEQGPGMPGPRPRRPIKAIDFEAETTGVRSVTQKMETPVLYFYAPSPLKIHVSVDFPQGIISQYYPAPTRFSPPINSVAAIAGGNVQFDVEILKTPIKIPSVEPSSVYAPSREVASDYLRVGSEAEKLIFYRGVGRFQGPVSVTSRGDALSIYYRSAMGREISGLQAFLVHVDQQGRGNFHAFKLNSTFRTGVPNRVSAEIVERLRTTLLSRDELMSSLGARLTSALVETGLYEDESRAMVKTWERSYFQNPGTRLLYVLDRDTTDSILPITLDPRPSSLVRTLVGRIEILTDAQEQSLIAALKVQGSNFNPVSTLGRFAEPALRRVAQIPGDHRALAEQALARVPGALPLR